MELPLSSTIAYLRIREAFAPFAGDHPKPDSFFTSIMNMVDTFGDSFVLTAIPVSLDDLKITISLSDLLTTFVIHLRNGRLVTE